MNQLSGAFSGLLAAAIQKMDGIGGRAGWAWIFILVSTRSSASSLLWDATMCAHMCNAGRTVYDSDGDPWILSRPVHPAGLQVPQRRGEKVSIAFRRETTRNYYPQCHNDSSGTRPPIDSAFG